MPSKHETLLKEKALEILESVGMGSCAGRWAGDLVWAER
jgi:hypothetical protein